MNPPPPQSPLGSAPTSRPVLDLILVPTEVEPMEIEQPPAAPAPAPRRLPATMGTTNIAQRIFREFTSRRAALIRAITTDEEEFFHKCNPDSEEMCLYGHTDGSWEVCKPTSEVPTELPEPVIGINLVRDTIERVQWLQRIAMHCDSWLIRVSFFVGARLLNAIGREHLFTSINSLPTVHEEFLESDTYHRLCHYNEERSTATVEDEMVEDVEEVEDDDGYFCGICGVQYHANAFWISCDVCKEWFHGRCVNVTQDQSTHLGHFLCPDCCSENTGHDYD